MKGTILCVITNKNNFHKNLYDDVMYLRPCIKRSINFQFKNRVKN